MATPGAKEKLGKLTAAAVKALRTSHISVERAPLLVMWLDGTGRIRRVNARGAAMLGRDAADLAGTQLQSLLVDDHAGAFDDLWRAGPEAGDFEGELELRCADGHVLPVDVAASHVEVDGDAYNCVFARDVTERREADRSLRAALEEVRRLKNRLQEENVYLRDEIRQSQDFDEIIGGSEALATMLGQLQQVAPSEASVLLLGESGTGKELLARAIHARSARADGPLVKVNCAALPEALIESELFGHERGAFTGAHQQRSGRFELADGGTLFLDEIGELPLSLQPKLLRALQEGEFERLGDARTRRVDVRVIAATNRDLGAEVEAGRFRADLFYRLNVFPLQVPPLRTRPGDALVLVEHFAQRYAARLGGTAPPLPDATRAEVAAYPWPGNVRELQNFVERAVILGQWPALAAGTAAGPAVASVDPVDGAQAPLPTLREVEVRAITAALERTGGVVGGKRGAARLLDMPESTLRERIARYGIVARGGTERPRSGARARGHDG